MPPKNVKTRKNKVVTPSPTVGPAPKKKVVLGTRTPNVRRPVAARGLTTPGLNFLKVAFAAPDFDTLPIAGVPDTYTGRTLVKTFRSVDTLTLSGKIVDASGNGYMIVPPIPGMTYFYPSNPTSPSSSTVWTGKVFPTYDTVFGSNPDAASTNAASFRIVSNVVELVPTTNALSWTGSIAVYKTNLEWASALTAGTGSGYTVPVISGVEGITGSNSDQFTTPSNMGIFASATSSQPDFDWVPVTDGMRTLPPSLPAGITVPGAYGSFTCDSARALPGMSSLDTIVIAFRGVVAPTNTFMLKRWSVVELQINNQSALYDYSTPSATYDPIAMQMYRDMVRSVPIAVSYYENANFWQRLIDIMRSSAAFVTRNSGTIAGIARGVAALA